MNVKILKLMPVLQVISVRSSVNGKIFWVFFLQIAGMLLYYICSRGRHPLGDNQIEITGIQSSEKWVVKSIMDDIDDLCQSMMSLQPQNRPTATNALQLVLILDC